MSNPKSGIDPTGFHINENGEFQKTPFHPSPENSFVVLLEDPTNSNIKVHAYLSDITPNAVHVDIDNEFGVMPEKLSVGVTDWFILEDANGVKHKAHLVDGSPDAFHKSVPNELAEPTIPYKPIIAATDRVMIESQADGGEKQYTESAGIDSDALHKSSTDGFDDIPIKATPTLSDWFVIQDSVTGNVYRVNLVGDGLDNFHKSMSNEFSGPEVPYKDVLANDDRILLESQVDGGAKRYTNSDGVDTTAFHSTIKNEIHSLPWMSSANLTPEDRIVIERSAYDWDKAATSLSEIISNAGSASGENLDPTKFGWYSTVDDQVLKFKSFDSIEDSTYQALNIVEESDWFNIRLDSSKINISQIIETTSRNFVTENDITTWNDNTNDINDLEQWRIEAQGEINKNTADIANFDADINKNASDIAYLQANAVQSLHTEGDPGSQFILSKNGPLMIQRRILSANNILGLSINANNSLVLNIDQSNIVGLGIQQNNLNMGGKYISNIVLDPSPQATDVATIGYVDNKIFSGNDPFAVHVNVNQEIALLPQKVSPLDDGDIFIIESSTGSLFNKEKVNWATIKESLGQLTDIDAIHINGVNDFGTIPTDNNPASTDKILAEDLGGNKKKILFSTFDVPANDPDAIHVNKPNEILGITNTGGTLALTDLIVCEKIIAPGTDHEKRSTSINEIINLANSSGLRDNDAIHYNGVDEFLNIVEKTSLNPDDLFIYEDSTSDPVHSKSKVKVSNIKIDNSDSKAFHSNVNDEWISIYALPRKTTIAGTDLILLQDSGNSNSYAYGVVSDLPSTSGGPGTDTTAFHYDAINEFDNIPGFADSYGDDFVLIENNKPGDPNEGKKFKQSITQLFFTHGGGGGEVNHGKNIGSTADPHGNVYAGLDGPDLKFRRLESGGDQIYIHDVGDHIDIDLVPSKAGPAIERYVDADKLIYKGGITHPLTAHKFSYANYLELQSCLTVCGISSGVFSVTVGELQTQVDGLAVTVGTLGEDVLALDGVTGEHTDQIGELQGVAHEKGNDDTLGIQVSDINMGFHKITNLNDPTNDQDAATKKWVESQADQTDVMNFGDDGQLQEYWVFKDRNPTNNNQFRFKYLKPNGGILTIAKTQDGNGLGFDIDTSQITSLGQQISNLDMGTYKIENLDTPVGANDTDAANVKFVKDHVATINMANAGNGTPIYAGELDNEYKFKTIETTDPAKDPLVIIDNGVNGIVMGVDMERINKLGAMSADIQMGDYSITQAWSSPDGLFKTADMDSSILIPFKTLNSDVQWYDWINKKARNTLHMGENYIDYLAYPPDLQFINIDYLRNRPIGYRMFTYNCFYSLELRRATNNLDMGGFKAQNLGLATEDGDALSLQGLLDRVYPIEPDDPNPRWKNMAKNVGKKLAIAGLIEGAVKGVICLAVILLDDGNYRYLTDEELESGQEADAWELRMNCDQITNVGVQLQSLDMGSNQINNLAVAASPLDTDAVNAKWVKDHTSSNIYVDDLLIRPTNVLLDWLSPITTPDEYTNSILIDNVLGNFIKCTNFGSYSEAEPVIIDSNLNLNSSKKIINSIDPTSNLDVANKQYVDTAVSSLEERIIELEGKLNA